ncbi:hypothetical protein SUDANB120_00792 [Streptomyces sp. enrichment culture]
MAYRADQRAFSPAPAAPFRPTGISSPVERGAAGSDRTKRRPEHHPETGAPQIATRPAFFRRPAAVGGWAARQIAIEPGYLTSGGRPMLGGA